MIVAGLAPERIIVIGELTKSWHRFGPVIESEVRALVLQGGFPPLLIPAHEEGMARLRELSRWCFRSISAPNNAFNCSSSAPTRSFSSSIS